MQIEVEKGAFWALIRCTLDEMPSVVERLSSFARELDPRKRGLGLCTQVPAGLRVPAGVVHLFAPQRPILSLPEMQRVRVEAERLEAAGLLRDYQARAVASALCAPLGRGCVDVAMGGGKTRIAAGLAAVAQSVDAGGSWLYLVQNGELARQSGEQFDELLRSMAKALGSFPAHITSTTYAGVAKLPTFQFDGVVVDECHLLPAPTRCVPFARVKADWRVGMSGTMLDRQDAGNALMVALLGPAVCKVGIPELESQGHLAKGGVQIVRYDRALRRVVS